MQLSTLDWTILIAFFIILLSIIYKKPIGNGIITCLNKKHATQRSSIKINKGKESAKAMLSLFKITGLNLNG